MLTTLLTLTSLVSLLNIAAANPIAMPDADFQPSVTLSTRDASDIDTTPTKSYALEARANTPLQLVFQSAYDTYTTVNAYIYGTRNDGSNQKGFVTGNGGWYPVPSAGASNTPLPSASITIQVPSLYNKNQPNITFNLPYELTSARISYSVNGSLAFAVNGNSAGTQIVPPSSTAKGDASYNVFWGFTEFTYASGTLNTNPTAVDFAGTPHIMQISNSSGTNFFGGGIVVDAVTPICSALVNQTNHDGLPWGSMCVRNNRNQLVRVLSPNSYRSADFGNPNAFNNYYEPYVDQVWNKYTTDTLTLAGYGSTCQVQNGNMVCSGGSVTGSYAKPSTAQILGCAGNAASVPAICAGFHRSTLLTNTSTPCGPVSSFYQNSPVNYSDKIVHQNQYAPGSGYTFAYDDATAPGVPDQSNLLKIPNVRVMNHIIGGFGFPPAGEYSTS